MGNEDAVYKLFQQLPDHPELITAENVAMLPVNAWAGVLIRLAQDNLQTAGVGEDVLAELDITSAWKKDDYDKFISLFDRWPEIPGRTWNELLMWYPEFEEHCPEDILKKVKQPAFPPCCDHD